MPNDSGCKRSASSRKIRNASRSSAVTERIVVSGMALVKYNPPHHSSEGRVLKPAPQKTLVDLLRTPPTSHLKWEERSEKGLAYPERYERRFALAAFQEGCLGLVGDPDQNQIVANVAGVGFIRNVLLG